MQPATLTAPPKLRAHQVCKYFGGVHALDKLDLEVRPATIHCVVGENGAGKSTLMKIFSGVVKKDAGSIYVDGKEVNIASPRQAKDLGIGIIYQELSLVPDMTVAENVFLEDLKAGGMFVSPSRLNARAKAIIDAFGLDIEPTARVRGLSVAKMQIVEIAKVLAQDVKILILDEPTAVLAGPEIRTLFDTLFALKQKGMTIIYISHRLEEILEIADDVSVIKDGVRTGVLPREGLSKDLIITAMTGRDLADIYPRRVPQVGDELFRAEDVSQEKLVRSVSLTVNRGEVVGIAGLVGSGRSEFARAVFGIDRIVSGELFMRGQPVRVKNARAALRHSIGLAPENRKEAGLSLDMSIAANISATNLGSVSAGGFFISDGRENDLADSYVQSLNIKRGRNADPVSSLSGGNQQKVVLAKWLNSRAEFLILDEPTRGVDVGARYDIYTIINSLAASGKGLLVISSEMAEHIGICDRIYVFSEGRVAGSLSGPDMTEETIMRLAIPAGEK